MMSAMHETTKVARVGRTYPRPLAGAGSPTAQASRRKKIADALRAALSFVRLSRR
jgi:hypothetical protein